MALTKYDFIKLCDAGRLAQEIEESAIVTALDRIETASGTDIWFKAELSGGDETILEGLVDSHVNTPLPDNEVKTVSVQQIDSDTGGLKLTPKFAPDNWHQQYFETEFETSKINSIHEKDWNNVDIGFSSLKFYDVNDDELVKGAQTDAEWQAVLDTDCVRTDLSWMPDHDYAIKSGFIAQKEVPTSNVYIWALGADLPEAYGGPQAIFAQGGLNLVYVDARSRSGLDGVAATVMYYEHPQLGAGVGTNKIRFVTRHPAGFKHRLQAVLEIFIPND